MTPVAVAGSAGKMGLRIIQALSQSKRLSLKAALERPGHPAVGSDAGTLAGLPVLGIPVSGNLAAAKGVEILIDFTSPAATEAHFRFARDERINLVVGTTGLSRAQEKLAAETARSVAVVLSPNMGVGINALLGAVRALAKVLGEPYDIEIIESHHRHKVDAPSGTALGLAAAAAEGRGLNLSASAVYGRKGETGPRKPSEIGIHSIRGGDTIGEHAVVFAGPGEKIELSHSVVSRDVFAIGAVRAAEFLAGKAAGLFTMRDVLGLPA